MNTSRSFIVRVIFVFACYAAVVSVSAQDYSVTTTGNAIVVTDNTGGGDTLNVTQPLAGNIRFTEAGATRTFSVDGGAFITGNSGNLSLTGINSITVNAQGGNDTVSIAAMTALPSLTVNGGTGNDTVSFTGNVTFNSDANLDLDLQNDDATPGTDQFNVNSGADVILSGLGFVTVRVSRNILFTAGSILRTANGNILLEANLQATPTAESFQGIDVGGTTVEATGTGVVTLSGRGGNGAANRGVYVRRLSSIAAAVRGGTTVGVTTTSVTGQGGVGSNPHGVDIDAGNVANGAQITSAGGNVFVNGTAGNTSGANNYGVIPVNGGVITSGGNGNVVVQGTGGAGTGGGNIGVIPHQGVGTITSGGNGTVTVTGTGGNGPSSHGIQFFRTGRIISGGAGAVSVTGTGGGANGHGVWLNPVDGAEQARIGSGGGTVTVQGTPSGNAIGIILAGSTAGTQPHITSSGNADVTIISDTMVFDGGGTSQIGGGTGIVNLRQLTNGRGIALGGVDSGSGVGLTDGELDFVIASVVNIGNANTGSFQVAPSTISQTKTINIIAPVGLSVQSFGDLGIFGTITGVTTSTGTIRPGASPGVINSIGNFTMNPGSGFVVEFGGTTPGNGANNYDQLNVTGTVNITNAVLTTASFGGFSPTTADSFVIINNDGVDAVIGMFAGMPQGHPIPNFAGNGLAGVIRYDGGDGNDVVIQTRLSPTSANVGLAGRVVTSDGRGIAYARVTIAGGQLAHPRVSLTNPFGYYSFVDLPAGFTYVVSVGSKTYNFTPPTRVVTLNDGVADFVFVADPIE